MDDSSGTEPYWQHLYEEERAKDEEKRAKEIKRKREDPQWEKVFRKLPEGKADSIEDLRWVYNHDAMGGDWKDLTGADIKTAPSKGAANMLWHCVMKDDKQFFQKMRDLQAKAGLEDKEIDSVYSRDPSVRELEALIEKVEEGETLPRVCCPHCGKDVKLQELI